MAKEFLLTSSGYGGRYMKLECTQTPNVAGNYSDISWTLTVLGGSSNYYSTGPTEVLIGGTQVYQCGRVSYTSKSFPAAKGSTGGTLRVYHNDADGKKTVEVRLTTAIYTSDEITASGNWELEPIARASEISMTDANIESAATVVVSRKNAAFTHSIAYRFGSLQGYLDAGGNPVAEEVKFTKTTLNFTLPESFYSQIPDDPSGQGSLTCSTYSGTTLIGTGTCGFTATAAQSRCGPRLEAVVVDGNPVSVALTGDENTLIRFVSVARCYATAQAQKSAGITQLSVDGQSFSGEYLDISGTVRDSYTVTARDSRGYSASCTVHRTLIPYVALTANPGVSRTSPTSDKVTLTLRGNCYKGSFGAAENTLQVKCLCNGQEQVLEPQWNGDHSYTAQLLLTGLDYTRSYPVEVTVTDAVTAVTKTVTVQPGLPVFDWGKSDFSFHVPVTAPSISGVFLGTRRVWVESGFSFQSKYTGWTSEGGNRQSIFLFGNANNLPVSGVIGIESNGSVWWSGSEGVSVEAEDAGRIRVNLGRTAYDYFTLLSAEPFSPE